jgi:hypothetical protein
VIGDIVAVYHRGSWGDESRFGQRHVEREPVPGHRDLAVERLAGLVGQLAGAPGVSRGDVGQGEGVDAVVSSAFWSAVGASSALEEGELDGPMVIGSFDVIEPLLNGIRDGNVDFTVGQDPYSQGFQNVPLAWMYLERGIEMKDLEWGVSVWDEDNVDFALERRNWSGDGGLLEWQLANYDFLQD